LAQDVRAVGAFRRDRRPAIDRSLRISAKYLADNHYLSGRVAVTLRKALKTRGLETGQVIGRLVPRVATARKHGLTLLLAAALIAPACRRSEPQPTAGTAGPTRGGELVASIRSEPPIYNRFASGGANTATMVFTLLTQATLVRVNRVTDELEPWLAEGWKAADDGVTYTITLRPDLKFSDGQPMTSADVVFTFRVAYDDAVGSFLASALKVHDKPLVVSAPDPRTVVIRFPERFAPGLRLLDSLHVLPRHVLEPALDSKQFASMWVPSKPASEVVGMGPFVLVEHVSGRHLVLQRNPHYFRRDAKGVQLPYLDKLTLAVIPDQNTEALRLEAAEIDLMTNADIRPQDYATFKRLSQSGRLKLLEGTIGLDPDFLSFNLRPAGASVKRAPWLARKEFRQAISCAVDRQAIVNAVYLGAAVPIFGPVSPGNRRWYTADAPTCADRDRARQILTSLGFQDRNGDGTLEDGSRPVRFSVMTQAGHLRERVSSVLQEQLRQIGIGVDIVALDPGGLFKRWQAGDYDAIYFGLQASSTDPALNPEFWLSSGPYHFWNPGQAAPATAWERRIDELMREQMTAADFGARQRAFAEVQKILADELPSIYFVAPRVTLATSAKVVNPTPAPQIPQLLWAAETLAATGSAR
jgi:peptide/nickel transport system substrate-binding protein